MHDEEITGEAVIVRRVCVFCQKPSSVKVPAEVLTKINAGEFVQNAWPQATPGERETLISGSHEVCYDSASMEPDGDDAA